MNQETITKVLATHQEIECLEAVKKAIDSTNNHRLSYLEYRGSLAYERSEWRVVNMDVMKYAGDILDRHDLQIRQEIDNRIEQLKQELEQL